MLMAMASAISASLCGVLNTHLVFAFAGSTIRADAAIEIIGVSASATTSTIASELGVIVEPTMTSTLSSEMSLRVLVTALVVSEPSSRTIQLTFCPPMLVGSSSNVFFSGMPSDAAGPVADNVTPTLMSPRAGAVTRTSAAASAGKKLRTCIESSRASAEKRETRGRRMISRPSVAASAAGEADACGIGSILANPVPRVNV